MVFNCNYSEANVIVGSSMAYFCRNFTINSPSHNQAFSPGNSISFSYSVDCPLRTFAIGTRNPSYPTRCDTVFGLSNSTSQDFKTAGLTFDYTFGRVNSTLSNVGGGYVRCSGSATYSVPSGTNAVVASIYPYFVGYSIFPGGGGMNIGSIGEHIIITQPCTLPWGGTINSGSSVTAYNTSSVACGSSCASQTRTCSNGSLSGSYLELSCSVAACPCTLPWGGTIASGASVTAYATDSVPCGSTCSSQTRTCSNGSLSGSYLKSSCGVETCCTCSADYYNVAQGVTTGCVGAKNVCGSNCKKIFNNNCGFNIFAPAKTTTEWNSFIGNFPSCVTVTNCP